MPREYSFVVPGLTGLTTTVPFVQLATPATTGIRILRIELGQEASETSAQLVVSGQRRSTASTLPTAATLVALSENDPVSLLASSTTTNAYGISSATGTAGNVLHRWTFNALNGLLFLPTPDEQIFIKPSSFWTLQFTTAPPSLTWSAHIVYQEVD